MTTKCSLSYQNSKEKESENSDSFKYQENITTKPEIETGFWGIRNELIGVYESKGVTISGEFLSNLLSHTNIIYVGW